MPSQWPEFEATHWVLYVADALNHRIRTVSLPPPSGSRAAALKAARGGRPFASYGVRTAAGGGAAGGRRGLWGRGAAEGEEVAMGVAAISWEAVAVISQAVAGWSCRTCKHGWAIETIQHRPTTAAHIFMHMT